jgi:hypothetical protein
MRMITAGFVRAIERFAGDLCLHFLPLFQKVVAIKKTCNQLSSKTSGFDRHLHFEHMTTCRLFFISVL